MSAQIYISSAKIRNIGHYKELFFVRNAITITKNWTMFLLNNKQEIIPETFNRAFS